MLLFVVIGIIQSMAFSYLTVVLSTIEKRFGLKSKEATWIYSGNEISQVAFFFALPFVGRVKRRPLFMGLSIMLSALGLFIIAFPHFTGEQSYLTDLNEQVCFDSERSEFIWAFRSALVRTLLKRTRLKRTRLKRTR